MKLVSTDYPFAKLKAMTVDEQFALAKTWVRDGEAVKNGRENFQAGALVIGKYLCILEEDLEAGKKLHFFRSNMTLAERFKDITGAKAPNHALTLKNAFGTYVRTGLITEADYDANSNNCLELAAHLAEDVSGNLQHPAVLAAAKLLITRDSKVEAKELRALRDGLKPAKVMTVEEKTAEVLSLMDSYALHIPGGLSVLVAHLPDLFGRLVEKPDELKPAYIALVKTDGALERIEAKLSTQAEAWANEATDSKPRIIRATPAAVNAPAPAPAPVPTPPAETPAPATAVLAASLAAALTQNQIPVPA